MNDIPIAAPNTPIVIDLAQSSPTEPPISLDQFTPQSPNTFANDDLASSPPSVSEAESAIPVSPDYQDDVLAALDQIYDGGRHRVAMREHEMFHLLVHVHVCHSFSVSFSVSFPCLCTGAFADG